MKTATPLLWDTPLGFAVGFEPTGLEQLGIEALPPVPLVRDDQSPSATAACYHSGDDLIIQRGTEPPTPVDHPVHGKLWPHPDYLLFRTQEELDAWAAQMS